MTGFRDRHGLGRCCCSCEDCCNGSYPTEYDVEFTFTDGQCTECEQYSTTFTLAKLATCNWRYDSGWGLSDSCAPPYGEPIKRVYISLSIRCINDTQYGINLDWSIWRTSANCPGMFDSTTHYFAKIVNVADWSCDGASNYAIPWGSSGSFGWTFNPVLGRCTLSTISHLCAAPANAYLTAVP